MYYFLKYSYMYNGEQKNTSILTTEEGYNRKKQMTENREGFSIELLYNGPVIFANAVLKEEIISLIDDRY